jgi:hypothetical protein
MLSKGTTREFKCLWNQDQNVENNFLQQIMFYNIEQHHRHLFWIEKPTYIWQLSY